MKKNILSLILFCCIGLFASCSDDDNISGADAGMAHLSVILPEGLSSGMSETAGYKIRYILELWKEGENGKPAYRHETAVAPAAGNRQQWDLNISEGAYHILAWADYIQDETTYQVADGTARYKDNHYDTSDLRNITVKDMNSLIDNDACDACYYSGEIRKSASEALVMEINMIRPFTKVSILEKNLREFNRLLGLQSSYLAASGFDASTGKASAGKVQVNHSVGEFNPEKTPDGTLFSTYIFANSETEYMDEIHLSFTTKQGIQEVTIPAALVPLARNQHIKVSGNMMRESPEDDTQFEIVYDIDITDWTTGNTTISSRPIRPKVGDFFYADGTFSSTFKQSGSNPCIGVVFAVAHDGGKAASDKAENYITHSGTQKLNDVQGWVIGLKDVTGGKSKLAPAKVEALDTSTLPATALGRDKTDILGFKNTECFKDNSITLADYPIAEAIINYENSPATKAPANTSGWYWGAVDQYMTLAKEYASVTVTGGVVTDYTRLAVGLSFQTLIEAGLADEFSLDGEQFYWSNSIDMATGKLYRVGLSIAAKNYGQTAAWKTNDARHARPILTF